MYNIWFDQLLVTGKVRVYTGYGGANVCRTSSFLVIRSACQFNNSKLDVQHIWVLP